MFFFLFLWGNFATTIALPETDNNIRQTLACTNDFEARISCDFEAPNCTEYNVTLSNQSDGRMKPCYIKLCGIGRCCCTTPEMMIIHGQSHEATVQRGDREVARKIFSVRNSMKPKTPNIISIKESSGNFQILWEMDMSDVIRDSLEAVVTYHIKGDSVKNSTKLKPPRINGLDSYEIPGKDLLPNTAYVVSVQTRSEWSGLLSDSSEMEFTTPVSWTVVLVAVIVSLSIAAVVISVVTYCCYLKIKTKFWDSVRSVDPKLLDIRPGKQKTLKPVLPDICSVWIEPFVPEDGKPWSKVSLNDSSGGSLEQSSGISSGSSYLSYANTEPADIIAGVQEALSKAFASINLAKPPTALAASPQTELNRHSGLLSAPDNLLDVSTVDVSPGSSSFENKSYFVLLPSLPDEIEATGPEVKAEMICDSAYHPSEGNTMSCSDQQAPACPLVSFPPAASSCLMSTDMSYQQCQADSGSFSYGEEDCSLTSGSSGTNTDASSDLVSRVEAEYESYADATDPCRNAKIDENPCYGCLPAASLSFPPVDNDYQAFENLVEPSNIPVLEKKAGEDGETLNKSPEQIPVVPGILSHVQGGQCLLELQRPFLSVLPANQSVITDNDYQRV